MEATSKLLIKKLVLVGHRKNYEIPFNPGVNIIFGEEDSGKSSILELINYLLGSNKLDRYVELEESVKYAVLELDLNDITYCIKRDIFDAKREIEVFTSSYNDIDKVFPKKYKPNFNNSLDDEFFSDFLLDALNFPKIKIKNAPSKDNSILARLSFRDLFKFCYINQDNVGSKGFLNNQDFYRYPKIKEVFKYIFNLNDEEIASLQQLLAERTEQRKDLSAKITYIKEFLETINIQSLDSITNFLEDIKKNLEIVDIDIKNLNNSITGNSKEYEPLRTHLQSLSYQIQDLEKNKKSIVLNIKRYEKLINDYFDDQLKFKSIIAAKDVIGALPVDMTICPLCEHVVEQNKFIDMYSINDASNLESEIKLLNKRIKDVKELLDDEKATFRENDLSLKILINERDELKKKIDEDLAEHISPYLTQRDEMMKLQASLIEKEKQIIEALKIRNEELNLGKKITVLEDDISKIKTKLEGLSTKQLPLENVLSTLKLILETYLLTIQVKNCRDVNLSEKSYLPVLRKMSYDEITSGGIRTVLSIGFLLSILEYSLSTDTNLPRFLMIDTVGKYLQKTKNKYMDDTDSKEDIKEEIKSAAKYKNLYEYIINLSIRMEEANKICQIILVDNDVPSFIEEEYRGFVVKKFSKDPSDHLPIGLIDDYTEDMY